MGTQPDTVVVEVVHSRWTGSDGDTVVFDLSGGTHEVDLASHPAAAALVAGAVSAGSLRLVGAELEQVPELADKVEPDEVSLAYQAQVEEVSAELLPVRDDAIDARVAYLRAEAELARQEAAASEDPKLLEQAVRLTAALPAAIDQVVEEESAAHSERLLEAIDERGLGA